MKELKFSLLESMNNFGFDGTDLSWKTSQLWTLHNGKLNKKLRNRWSYAHCRNLPCRISFIRRHFLNPNFLSALICCNHFSIISLCLSVLQFICVEEGQAEPGAESRE